MTTPDRQLPDHQASPPASDNEERADAALLGLLLRDGEGPLWAVDELIRELGDAVIARDSLSRLERVGLVHRVARHFVQASRAARYGQHLYG